MQGVSRVDCTGHIPHVEYRQTGSDHFVYQYFVCFEDLRVELVMAFEDKITAREIAVNVFHGTPFFTAIPVVPYNTPYPRPWLVYPDLDGTWRKIDLRVMSRVDFST